LIEEYIKRLSAFTKLDVIEIKDSTQKSETNKMLDYVNSHSEDFFILLDEQGEELGSIDFSKKLNKLVLEHQNITFLIAGADGFTKDAKKLIKNHISLSKLTFPHEIARLLLVEQIYRAFMIKNNRSYHKE